MTCVRTGLVALCVTVLASHAQAQAKSPGKDVAAPASGAAAAALAARGVFTKSCPNMIQAQILRLPDGGYAETYQAWFAEAWTERDMLMCSYGIDGAKPMDRPALRVHYDIAPHKSVDCKVFGPTISCTK